LKILALIPARGGSKGLPFKNIKPLLGHPLISYSIKLANDSNFINRTIVSTDCEDIAKIGRQYGAEAPFLRPAEISGDLNTDMEVFMHTLNWLKVNEEYVPDFIVQLRPTSPIRFVNEVDECIGKLIDSDADSLRIITPAPCTPYKMWTLDATGDNIQPLLKIAGVEEPYNLPRQGLPKVYWQVGTLDVIRTSSMLANNSLSGSNILGHIIPNELSVDIDNLGDFKRAEEIITQFKSIRFDDDK
jgi:CMP-N,N'-diacetyllegionaminic acid synthase